MSARRPWAWPLVPLYGAGLAAKDALRVAGFRRDQRLQWPVISIGSVSAGGAGKTPLTIALANLLASRGWTVDVLSRGYRRSGRGVEKVNPLAPEAARRYGDEPTLIAQRTSLPVWVGSDRFAAGAIAERSYPERGTGPAPDRGPGLPKEGRPEAGAGVGAQRAIQFTAAQLTAARFPATPDALPCVHLLDDGMQHRRLSRSFELVLVTARDLVDVLLPAGDLREPLTALRRADALAVREEELTRIEPRLRAIVGPDVPLWTVRRTLRFPAPLGVFGAGLRPLAFCALARPENFAEMLAKAGCGVVDTVIFNDHHRYTERDINDLIRLANAMDATGLITTEKDAVKLSPAVVAKLEASVGPLMVVALEAAFVYESPVMRLLGTRLRAGAMDLSVRDEVRSK